MNILLAANEKYYLATKVMLASLLENNAFEHHNIYFLNNMMSEKSIRNLKKYVEKECRATFIPIKVNMEDFEEFPLSHHFSIETYFRFLVQDILPENEQRVMWLDVDMVVLKSLYDFYYQDFDEKSLIVCKSINKNPQALLDKLQCPPGTIYFNAGMILFNLEKVRRYKLVDYRNYYEKNKERITWLDQDILNGMYALDTKIVDYKKYNLQFFNETIWSENDLKQIEGETVILHYIGNIKPWSEGYTNSCAKYWYQYAKESFSVLEKITLVYKKGGTLSYIKGIKNKIINLCRTLINYRKKMKKIIDLYLKLCFPFGEKVYLLGTPVHQNIGDSAIVLAERLFLEKCGYDRKQIKEITVFMYDEVPKVILWYINNRKYKCFWHGGGNLGNQWLGEELFRRRVFEELPDMPMLIFPQTIYYTSTPEGEKEKNRSINYYNKRFNLTIVAREKMSFAIMKELYPLAHIILTPDIVLSTRAEDYGILLQQRKGVLVCLRNDIEKKISEIENKEIEEYLINNTYDYRKIDMYAEGMVTIDNRDKVVKEKMEEFAHSKLVITDRLHGMIFSAITATPCVVFDNVNHKVKGAYEWVKHLPYIRYVNDINEMKENVSELLEMGNLEYDNQLFETYFRKLALAVRK